MEGKNRTSSLILLAIILLIIAGFLLFFLNGSETRISEERGSEKMTALSCKTGNSEEAFFNSETANTVENVVKITFKDDKLDKVFYSYEGTYRSYDVAEQENANFHAKYNKYLSPYGINPEILTPTFLTSETKFRINLYAESSKIINNKIGILLHIFLGM